MLARGANCALPTGEVVITLQAQRGDVDPLILLVDAAANVSSDGDFVFFNQPNHRSGAATVTGQTVRVYADRVPASTSSIIVAVTSDAPLPTVGSVTATITVDGRPVATATVAAEVEQLLEVVEIYRRGDAWKMRCIGQGYTEGVTRFLQAHGVHVDQGPDQVHGHSTAAASAHTSSPPTASTAPPPSSYGQQNYQRPADWYPSTDGLTLTWWNGTSWTTDQLPNPDYATDRCARCGQALPKGMFGKTQPCAACAQNVPHAQRQLEQFVVDTLVRQAPTSAVWQTVTTEQRRLRLTEPQAHAVTGPAVTRALRTLVDMILADGVVDADEWKLFDDFVAITRPDTHLVMTLRQHMHRLDQIYRWQGGDLARVTAPDLHLPPNEWAHYRTRAVLIKQMARGPVESDGELVFTNVGLKFYGVNAGHEMPWTKVLSAQGNGSSLQLNTTRAKGTYLYRVSDGELAQASANGAIKVAKRLTLAPGERDTRRIPQELKTQVWQRDGGKCVECGATEYLEYDHEIPFSRGGATSLANLRLLCRKCNLQKGDRI